MAVLDCLAVALSWIVIGLWLIGDSDLGSSLAIGAAGTVTTLAAMAALGSGQSRPGAPRGDEFGRIALAVFAGTGAFAFTQWQLGDSGEQAIICGGACLVLLSRVRAHERRWLSDRRGLGRYLRRVVVVGTNDDAFGLVNMLSIEPELGYEVTSVVGDGDVATFGDGLLSSPSLDDLPELARQSGSEGVLIVANALSGAEMHGAIAAATRAGLQVHVWLGTGVDSGRLQPVRLSGELFIDVQPHVVHQWQLVAKRFVDIVGSVIGLTLAAPVLGCAAALVKLGDSGPALYHQERIGQDGRPFTVYKIRSMTSSDAVVPFDRTALNERSDGPLFKSSRDPRVTPIGHYLRASGIDELPQLWNVLMGSMSLVGPRPALPEETAQFDQELLRRLTVRPGLTGLWQADARNNQSFNAYRRLDLRYIDSWSLALDLRILASTIPLVLSRALRMVRQRQSANAVRRRIASATAGITISEATSAVNVDG
jgi:exopolysaccharide biosynthesis polyprenyl glycosylphosphotransferase